MPKARLKKILLILCAIENLPFMLFLLVHTATTIVYSLAILLLLFCGHLFIGYYSVLSDLNLGFMFPRIMNNLNPKIIIPGQVAWCVVLTIFWLLYIFLEAGKNPESAMWIFVAWVGVIMLHWAYSTFLKFVMAFIMFWQNRAS